MTLAAGALDRIADGATARDQAPGVPPFPADAVDALREAGMLEPIVPLAEQLDAVRAVSRADGSVGRIFDGHVNAQERLGTAAYDGLLGVWGANPGPGEGEPAWVEDGRLYGVKTYCSGAGGVERALVLVDGDLLHVDLGEAHTTSTSRGTGPPACARPRRTA